MKCPYCNNEMLEGILEGGKDVPLRWIEDGEEFGKKNGLAARVAFAGDGTHIISKDVNQTIVKGYKCEICNKIIVNV